MRRLLAIAVLLIGGCKTFDKPDPWKLGSCQVGQFFNDEANHLWCVYQGVWWWCASDPVNGFYCRRIAIATPPPIPSEAR